MYLNKILHGNAIDVLRTLPDELVQTVVTSPPYWGLRDYGVAGQLGLEKSPEEYISKMVEIFCEVKRVLREDGTLWLNLGDTYWGGKGQSSQAWSTLNQNRDTLQKAQHQICGRGDTRPSDGKHDIIKPKDLCMIPARVAIALQADGWYLRSDIIWAKPNPMPESVTDRPTKAHEYIFLLSKNQKYYYDANAIKEKAKTEPGDKSGHKFGSKKNNTVEYTHSNKPGKKWKPQYGGGGTNFKGHSGNQGADGTIYYLRNKRTVWQVTTKPFPEAHFATFPPELIKPCILAGSPENGMVLDPFMGSGTTALVAKNLNRNYIGIELNAEYIKMAEERLIQVRLVI